MFFDSWLVFDLIISMVCLVFVMMRLRFDVLIWLCVGFSMYVLLMYVMCVVLIGLLNGRFDMVSVVDVLISVGMFVGIFGFMDSMWIMIWILL